jgi:imidazolonepropionase-like amidohydrolase
MKPFFFIAILALAADNAFAQTTVLDGFTLIDGTGGQPLVNAAIVIADGRIQWVGPQSKLKAPAGAQVTQRPKRRPFNRRVVSKFRSQ